MFGTDYLKHLLIKCNCWVIRASWVTSVYSKETLLLPK